MAIQGIPGENPSEAIVFDGSLPSRSYNPKSDGIPLAKSKDSDSSFSMPNAQTDEKEKAKAANEIILFIIIILY